MRFTRRLLDSQLSVLVAFLSVATGVFAASCTSESDAVVGFSEDDDSGADSAVLGKIDASDAPVDAGPPDSSPPRDAGSNPLPRPVVCATEPCVTSLMTSQGESFCALMTDGTVACWGDNLDNQLARANDGVTFASGSARRIEGLSDIVALDRACAVDKDGAVWCWGRGAYLRSTTGLTVEATPVKLAIPPAKAIGVSLVSSNQGAACALVGSGVLCWGSNGNGQVTPPVLGASATTPLPAAEVALPAGAAIRTLAVGNTSFVLREDGTALSWGANPPLGRVSSLFPDPNPRAIALSGITDIDISADAACAVADGIVYCWGNPATDYYSPAPPLDRALPQPVVIPEPVTRVATAGAAPDEMVIMRGCAVGESGDVYCWGNNKQGQAGDGTKTYATTPIKVAGLPGPVSQVKTTRTATCALLTTGNVYCWGDDAYGQIGNGKLKVPSLVPQEVVVQ